MIEPTRAGESQNPRSQTSPSESTEPEERNERGWTIVGGKKMYDVRPQESALERLRNEIEYILDDDTAGEVRITYLKDGHSEIKDAKVLLVDDIMHHFKKSLAQEYSRGATKELDWVLAATNNPDDPCYAPKIAREVADRIVELEKGQEDGR